MFSVGVVLDCHARWVPKATTRVIMSAGGEGIFDICDKLDAAWRGDFADRGFKLGDVGRYIGMQDWLWTCSTYLLKYVSNTSAAPLPLAPGSLVC